MGSKGSYSPSYSASPENKKVTLVQNVELNTRLFNQLIAPKMEFVKSLVHYYRNPGTDEDFIYSVVLEKLYRYITTYDQTKKLDTWIHICVKRYVFFLNKAHAEEMQHRTGVEFVEATRTVSSGGKRVEMESMLDHIPDEVYVALMQIPEYKLRPFMLYVQGYSLREIAEMEYENGYTDKLVEEVVKGRVFWTRNKLQKLLKEYGASRGLKNIENRQDDTVSGKEMY